jgi:hypothetical protein
MKFVAGLVQISSGRNNGSGGRKKFVVKIGQRPGVFTSTDLREFSAKKGEGGELWDLAISFWFLNKSLSKF